MNQTASRIIAVLFGLAASLADENVHGADTADELGILNYRDIFGAVESHPFDVRSNPERVSLVLGGEHLIFERNSYQQIADNIFVWSGKDVRRRDATYLYVARNGDDVGIKLARGNFEYDISKGSSGDHELRATDLRKPGAEDCLAGINQEVNLGVEQQSGTSALTSVAVAPPFEINVNLAYTRAALAQFPSATALKSEFAIGLARTNDTLKNSNLNVRVRLNRVVFVNEYTESETLALVREDVEGGLVPRLPVPLGKNKTVLVVDVFGKWNGTAILSGPYAIIKYQFISSLTLAHELGHTLGAIHLKAYQFTNGRWTVMTQDRTLREPIFSNPKVQWLGEPAGTSTRFNARRMCNEFLELGSGCWITPQ